MLTIDLYGRFSSAFGFVAANIRTRTQPHGTPSGVEVYVADATFADLKLKSAKDGKVYEFRNTILNATDKTTFVPDKKFFAPPPMLKFTRNKKITATAIAGSDNIVVEDFGLEQWEITMDGLLIDMNAHKYPTAEMQKFRQMFETPDVFDVLACPVMTDLGINALYFEKISELTVLESYPDTAKYRMIAHSIQPPEFIIND